jgi:hypothetical protein
LTCAIISSQKINLEWEVDDEVIYEILQEDIQDIKEFVDMFMGFISKNISNEQG